MVREERPIYRVRSIDLHRALVSKPIIEEENINNHFVVDVHFTDNMLITAVNLGIAIREEAEAKRKQLTEYIKGNEKNEIIGLEGAFATATYIFGRWRAAIPNIRYGFGDSGDLIIGDSVIDVKTSGNPNHKVFMLFLKQWKCHQRKECPYSYYIGCQEIKEDCVRIWGYAEQSYIQRIVKKFEKEEIQERGAEENIKWSGIYNFGYGPTITIPFSKLLDIRSLKEKLGTP